MASLVETSGADDDGRGILASISFFASFRNSSLLHLFGGSSIGSSSSSKPSSSTPTQSKTRSNNDYELESRKESRKVFNCCSAFCSDLHPFEQSAPDGNLCHGSSDTCGQTHYIGDISVRNRIKKDGQVSDDGCDDKNYGKECQKSEEEELVPYEVLPEYLQFNPFVLQGYRKPNMSSSECIKSLFYFHNETINIFTHVVSFLLFAFIMPGRLPWYGITRPILAYCTILGSFSSWVGSSMYHLFMNHKRGEQFYDVLLMIDVIGIWITQTIGAATTITTSVLLYDSNLQVALITLYVFLSLRALRDVLVANTAWTRILGFAYLFGLRVVAFGLRINAIPSGVASPLIHVIMQEGWALIGSVISATRVPERWFPGRFDYLFNSHNLMHLFVVFGALHMHAATSADLLWIKDIDSRNMQ